ncbi:MAG TPA: T9SS type A sorting domain-containing protein [Bacteroidia bacterium]|nr:T9SS type A sorting domain-containing protein [Bacteroidia bacterium]
MKKLFLIAFALSCFSAKSQYFQQLYGNSDHQYNGRGVNTTASAMGHFVVSSSSNTSTTGDLLAVNTDLNGNVLTFNNLYNLTETSGVPVTPANAIPVEFNNGSGFGVFGMYYDPSGTVPNGVYYLELDANGNIVNTTQFDPVSIVGTSMYVVEVADVSESASGNEFYITGTIDPTVPGGSFWVFTMKIDQGGNIIWSTIFDLVSSAASSRDWGKGVLESPYMPAGVQEVVVVGQTYDNGGSPDGFFLRLNANNGNPLGVAPLYGTAASLDQFTCITVSNSGVGGSAGFMIGGNSDQGGSWDMWMTKVSPTGASLLTQLYDYNGGSGNFDECTDIIERKNTSGIFDCYIGGMTNNGNIGNTDLVVVKVDENGNPYGNGQFTYGDDNYDRGTYLDYFDGYGTPTDGLSVFGTWDNASAGMGFGDAYLVKAYFNGLSGCFEDFQNTSTTNGPKLYNRQKIKVISKFNSNPMSTTSVSASDLNLCYSTSIGGGSNARTANPENGNGVSVSPNPMQAASGQLTVEMEATATQEVSVTLYDMLGRTYYSETATLQKGKNSLPLDVSNANLAPGMYTVKISGTTINETVLLQVK